MKFLRTVLLPLLLCGIILTVGFCSPTLFSAVVSDHKGQTERVAIAGQENPLYLENAAEVSLPPWDAIGDDRGVPLSAYSASTAEDVNSFIPALLKLFGAPPAAQEDFAAEMRVHNGQLISLRDYRYNSGDLYALDLVLQYDTLLPIYMHTRCLAYDTQPADDAEALLDDFRSAADLWNSYTYDVYALLPSDDADAIAQLYETARVVQDDAQAMFPDSGIPGFVQFFNRIGMEFAVISGQPANSDYVWYMWMWHDLLNSIQDSYALTYDDETVVVLTDYGNRPYTLYYDGSRDRITGFGLDASLVSYSADTAAFSEAASE